MILTRTEENYIKALYRLQANGGTVSTTELAREVSIKPASATDMLKKLKEKKLITYQAYYGCSLTGDGNRIALNIIRKHRLWEYFLCEKLGFEWDAVHDIAEELEHISNPELVHRLDAYLGHPKTDPHGDPIPDSQGQIPELGYQPLPLVQPGKPVTVMAVGNQSVEMLSMLKHFGISIGSAITIVQQHDFDLSLEISINHKETRLVSSQFASNILVQ
ncbi:MAG: metal-dependent transcriptional regulator [Dinghuibacter sp.]|nr:metal-dependent transcriptional regulator [Dinghuibacter sp.]